MLYNCAIWLWRSKWSDYHFSPLNDLHTQFSWRSIAPNITGFKKQWLIRLGFEPRRLEYLVSLLYQLSFLALAIEPVWLSHSLPLKWFKLFENYDWILQLWGDSEPHFILAILAVHSIYKICICITGSRGVVGTIPENLLLWKTTDHWQAFSPPYKYVSWI